MWQNILDSLVQLATDVGLRILYAFIILVIGLKLSNVLVRRISKGKGFAKLDESVQSFFKSCIGIVFKVLVIISAAVVLGIPTTSFITMIASCGVAIGLALQGSLSNFAGGLMILIFKPFKVGDYIEAEGYGGTVKTISIFYTTLLTADNRTVTLPNGTLTNNPVLNVTAEPRRRVDLDFSVSFESDRELVKSILLEAAHAHPMVEKDPEPFAAITLQSDIALSFQLRVWCDTGRYWDVYHSLNDAIRKAFDEQGITMPHSKMSVQLQDALQQKTATKELES